MFFATEVKSNFFLLWKRKNAGKKIHRYKCLVWVPLKPFSEIVLETETTFTQVFPTTVDQRFGCFSWPTRVDQLYLKLNKKLINFRNHDSGTKRNQKRNHSIFRWFRFVPDTKAEPCKFSLGSYQKQKRHHSDFSAS